jgi:hypothetical protein
LVEGDDGHPMLKRRLSGGASHVDYPAHAEGEDADLSFRRDGPSSTSPPNRKSLGKLPIGSKGQMTHSPPHLNRQSLWSGSELCKRHKLTTFYSSNDRRRDPMTPFPFHPYGDWRPSALPKVLPENKPDYCGQDEQAGAEAPACFFLNTLHSPS